MLRRDVRGRPAARGFHGCENYLASRRAAELMAAMAGIGVSLGWIAADNRHLLPAPRQGSDACLTATADWPPVISVENTPGFEVSDCALDRSAEPVYLSIKFSLPVEHSPSRGFSNGVMKPEPRYPLSPIPLKTAAMMSAVSLALTCDRSATASPSLEGLVAHSFYWMEKPLPKGTPKRTVSI